MQGKYLMNFKWTERALAIQYYIGIDLGIQAYIIRKICIIMYE